MELLILLGFLLGWATCWIQEQRYLNRLQSDLAQVTETEKALLSQLHHHSETVVAQEMQILKLEEKVLAQERELDSLRYKI
jgi:predicted  nucleic acid-binding Zn-ribbon protein